MPSDLYVIHIQHLFIANINQNKAVTELSIGCEMTNYFELAFNVSERYSTFRGRLYESSAS